MGSGGFSFVHAADLHLDGQFKGLERSAAAVEGLPDSVLLRLRNSSFEAFNNIVNLCISKKVDFLLLAGDIYDVADKSLRAQLKFRDGLVRLADAGIPAFVVHGNHDHCAGWRAEIKLPDTVHVFSDKEVETRPVLRQGREIASVCGISYPVRDVSENFAGRFARGAGDSFAVALLHCNVVGTAGHENYAPCKLDDLMRKGFDYWALGHVHKYALLHPARPCVAYPGCAQGRHLRETGRKGCLLVQVADNKEISAEFFSTAAVRWESLTVSVAEIADDLSLLEIIEDKLLRCREAADGKPIVAQVVLNGRGVLHKNLRRAAYIENLAQELRGRLPGLAEDFLWLASLRADTTAVVEQGDLAGTDTLLGDLLSLAKTVSQDQDLKAELRRELAVLLEHPRAGRYLAWPDDDQLAELLAAAGELAVDLFWDGED